MIDLNSATKKNILEDLLKRSPNQYEEYAATVAKILDDVKMNKDQALFDYTERFDKTTINRATIRVTEEEIEEAYRKIEPDVLEVIKKAIKNILKYIEVYGIKSGEPCMILQAENKEIRDVLKENMLERKKEFIECEVGCVVGTHSGTGACGIFFIENH
jgi:histidinol dehydrogenase